jgi:hypothetical protein
MPCRPRIVCLLPAVLATLLSACANPPDKEMNQARGAIAAARAAGAEQYAADEYQAAVAALDRASQAVEQRDYRQALSAALDSQERAQNAAKEAANQKAIVRSEAERNLAEAYAMVGKAHERLKAAAAARPRRHSFAAARASITAAERAVQEARAALGRGDYLAARKTIAGVAESLRSAIRQIDETIAAPAPRRRG